MPVEPRALPLLFAGTIFRSVIAVVVLGVLAVPAVGQVPGTANVPAFRELRDTQPTPDGVPTAQQSLAAMRLPPGFRATLFAGEPAVRQPIALATDQRGRLWVAENYSYAEREVNFDEQARDRIVVLEDKNQDGQFDQRTVFWDQASKLTSVEIGFGGVWALCPPHLLFLPDRNGDDIPDGPAEVMLDGWDADAVRHNIANELTPRQSDLGVNPRSLGCCWFNGQSNSLVWGFRDGIGGQRTFPRSRAATNHRQSDFG